MSIATAIQNAQAKVAAAYTKCNAKGATMPLTQDLAHLDDCIDSIPTGGGEIQEADVKDVIFIDYDGTRLYSYSRAEFLNLSEMPANPTHAGLTAQGWNWTLADAQAVITNYGFLVIGQNYITDDGKTRIYLDNEVDEPMTTPLCFVQSVDNGVRVDWGDGSAKETVAGTSGYRTLVHTYSGRGKYVISLEVLSGTLMLGGEYGTNKYLFSNTLNGASASMTALRKIELGSNLTSNVGYYVANKAAYNLKSVSIPNNYLFGSASWMQNFYSNGVVFGSGASSGFFLPNVKYISLPKTAIGFQNTQNITKLLLSPYLSGTSHASLFTGATSIRKVYIPSHVTNLNGYILSDSPACSKVIMAPTTPPTINGNASFGFRVRIFVPSASLSTYKTGTNWVKYSGQLYELGNPGGNTPLQYVTTDSSAWLDTGIAGATDLEIYVRFSYDTYIQYGQVYHNYIDENHKTNRVLLGSTEAAFNVGDGNTLGSNLSNLAAVGTVHTIKVSSGSAVIDGSTYSISSDSKDENTTNIVLGNRSTTSPVSRDIGLHIHRFLIKKAGAIVLDLVPVKSNGVAGFWDYVSASFKASSSGVNFTEGPILTI